MDLAHLAVRSVYLDYSCLRAGRLPFLYATHTIQRRRTLTSRSNKAPTGHHAPNTTPTKPRNPKSEKDSSKGYKDAMREKPTEQDRARRRHYQGGEAKETDADDEGSKSTALDSGVGRGPRRHIKSPTIDETVASRFADADSAIGHLSGTITDKEQEAFSRLFKMALSDKSAGLRSGPTPASPKKESDEAKLESHAASVTTKNWPQRRRSAQHHFDPAAFPEGIKAWAAVADEIIKERRQVSEAQERKAAALEQLSVADRQKQELERIEGEIEAARTDAEITNVLQVHVFGVFRRLEAAGLFARGSFQTGRQNGSDTVPESNKSTAGDREGRGKAKGSVPGKDKRKAGQGETGVPTVEAGGASLKDLPKPDVFRDVYSKILVSAARQLRQYFPHSTVSSAMLREIKNIGRTSYVLGVSGALYNELMGISWRQHSDPNGVDELLKEMDNGGVEFDAATLDLLDSIRHFRERVSRGDHGGALLRAWQSDRLRHGFERLEVWRATIRDRLEAEVLRQVNELPEREGGVELS